MMLTLHDMLDILGKVWYKDWTLRTGVDRGDRQHTEGYWLQWEWITGDFPYQTQRSRKWRLSKYMTPSEIVQTAFKAALTAEEHEAREAFKYKGESIFGPHFDIEALHELAVTKRISLREEPNGS